MRVQINGVVYRPALGFYFLLMKNVFSCMYVPEKKDKKQRNDEMRNSQWMKKKSNFNKGKPGLGGDYSIYHCVTNFFIKIKQ